MDPFTTPPLPTPDGQTRTTPVATIERGDWKSAPPVVKGWAYPLTWLSIIIFGMILIASLFTNDRSISDKVGGTVVCGIILAISIWLNQALKKGVRAAWTVQIIASAFGVLGFPVGTLIHGYILSQWFKPETKAWFGMN
ncbi:MAG TPA: hypothetical protein VF719_03600 [Abditibacteriaceae bacterium]